MKLRIASALAGLTAWVSLFLPWWSISGLGPPINLSPHMLLTLERNGSGSDFLQLSEGFYWLVVLANAFIILGGGVGVLRSFINKTFTFISGVLLLSSLHILTYAFIYIKVAGAVLCLTPTLFGAPLGWGLSYGFAVAAASGVLILFSVLYEV